VTLLQEALFLLAATSLVLGAALSLTRVLRGASAGVRHRVLACGCILGFILPALLPLLPAPTSPASVGEPASDANTPVAAEYCGAPGADPTPVGARAEHIVFGIGGIWLLGALIILGRLMCLHLRAHGIARHAHPVAGGRIVGVKADLCPGVSLRVSSSVPGPLLIGWIRARIILPAVAARWSGDELQAVLRHELAHVRRRDNLVGLIASLLVAFHWFNPLAWLVASRLRVEAELACDDAVIRAGVRSSSYARFLLDAASRLSMGPALPANASSPFAARARRRLASLLDPSVRRTAPGRSLSFLIAAAYVLLILPLTALRPPASAAPQLHAAPIWFPTDIAAGVWEIAAELRENRGLHAREKDPTLAVRLPEGVTTDPNGAWEIEAHRAFALAEAKYGCVFNKPGGYVHLTRFVGETIIDYHVARVPHPKTSLPERALSNLLDVVDLGFMGDFRAYRIEVEENGMPRRFTWQHAREIRCVLAEFARNATGQ